MAEKLSVKIRTEHGKQQVKKLRRAGFIPAILYGHGQENVNLAVNAEAVALALRHGSRFVNLTGEVTDSALIRDLQWDTYGLEVLHLDFARVSQDERIHLKVAVELKGTAQGVKDGGVIQHIIHDIEIECTPTSIPEKIFVNVTNLALGAHITAGEIVLPGGAKLLSPDAEEIVAQCVTPAEQPEEGAAAGEGNEPELIRKAKEEGADEEA
ncbi:MAG TPA: 50S ribosomal protein L25 [Pirellulales bacterium]|jgi:large subunit ribosomal protein L25|nr:50S ribosomal protein L25 [Pirellulales bacterium]